MLFYGTNVKIYPDKECAKAGMVYNTKQEKNMNYIDYIQISLLVVVVPALILVLIYVRRKEIKQIDTNIESFLKNITPQPMQEYEKSNLNKSYVTAFVCGFFLIEILFTIVETCIERVFFSHKNLIALETGLVYAVISLVIKVSGLVIGIIGPLLWISWDKKRIQTKAELVKLPAFVHSTSNLSTSYGNRTAYLVYYDRKKDRLRAKTVPIKKFESANGRLQTGEFVLIAVEEKNTRTKFVNIFKKTA